MLSTVGDSGVLTVAAVRRVRTSACDRTESAIDPCSPIWVPLQVSHLAVLSMRGTQIHQTRVRIVTDDSQRAEHARHPTGTRPATDRHPTGDRPAPDRQPTGNRPATDRQLHDSGGT
jgi:hypothetical protein